ncbi:hypothetical protein A4X09_0g5964 [Tilletia walkeri]|uniref:Kinesin motor domain-containing protein n=1 Tax=Tilletia walkeri TaxID=117179 RepID=A0A8X7T2S8_9BASI|nr:hypothetical protein A4X09_0g5964 [Tilletia walkeri]
MAGMLSKRDSTSSIANGLAAAGANGSGSNGSGNSTSVQVVVRIRPITNADQSSIPQRWQRVVVHPTSASAIQVDQSTGPPANGPGGGGGAGPAGANANKETKRQMFSFDRVLGSSDGQSQVYENAAEHLIPRFIEGFNVTILAYGQTSSGKSYTMGTAASDADYEALVAGRSPDPSVGIIPRAVAQIFQGIRQNQNRSGAVQYTMKVSFIEIYNEDLIDLLAVQDGESRPLVQIREGKNGQIMWQGLREVKVSGVADVMNHLLQGSSSRRTDQTDMNASSSRSHAIFSLTLVQRKFVGAGPAPPPSAAHAPSSYTNPGRTTPTGRTGLPRPSSTLGHRSSTPGGGSGLPTLSGRTSATGLRPVSMAVASPRSPSPAPGTEELRRPGTAGATDGEWTTITSKFHFVDLAGSERLKRTAAQGERAKEGISINSGLHALGNVISALGDPAKAKRTTHIPYRDSKLTRLLQDSLGGNAHTLMIACVSPAEYNVSETINTLQYANRARNIKNKAELNEVEVGWEDLAYLQTQVLKLRRELGILKGGKGSGNTAALRGIADDASQRAVAKELMEWQDKYAAASQKMSQMILENTKLKQMSHNRSGSAGSMSDTDFMQAAEPVIVEYEKVVDTLEGQINLMKAALSHAEDVITLNETDIEELSNSLNESRTALESRESMLAELQVRLSKLQDRERSADEYARDLEGRMQKISEREGADATVLTELRTELSRLKEAQNSAEQYISELESKVAKDEETIASLQAQIELAEKERERREEAYKDLQARMEMMDTTRDTKTLLEELDVSEQRKLELEKRLDEAIAAEEELAKEKSTLTDKVARAELDKGKAEDRAREFEAALAAAEANAAAATAAAASQAAEADDKSAKISAEEVESLQRELGSMREEVEVWRGEHQKSTVELEQSRRKYHESLREIHDLNHQLSELRLTSNAASASRGSSVSHSTAEDGGEEEQEVVEELAPAESKLSRRESFQLSRSGSISSTRRSGRPESLLLGEKEKTLLRRNSGSFLGYNPSDGPSAAGGSISRTASPNHNRTRSHSQSFAHEMGVSSGASTPTTAAALQLQQQLAAQLANAPQAAPGRRPLSLSGSLNLVNGAAAVRSPLGMNNSSAPGSAVEPSSMGNYERTIASLKKENEHLTLALKEREEELQALEIDLRQSRKSSTEAGGALGISVDSSASSSGAGEEASGDAVLARNGLAAFPSMGSLHSGQQTPVTDRELRAIKKLLVEAGVASGSAVDSDDEQMARLNDLLRSMARKETAHRDAIDSMADELANLRREKEQIQNSSNEQVSNLSKELATLRGQVGNGEEVGSQTPKPQASSDRLVFEEVETLRAQVTDLQKSHADEVQRLRDEQVKNEGNFSEMVQQLKQDFSASATTKEQEHQAAIEALKAAHEEEVGKVVAEHNTALSSLKNSHSELFSRKVADHEELVQRRVAEHGDVIERLKSEHDRALKSRADEHAAALREIELSRQSDAAVTEEDRAALHSQLKQEHSTELQRLRSEHEETLAGVVASHEAAHNTMKADYDDSQKARDQEHEAAMEELLQGHASKMESLAAEHRKAVEAAVAAATAAAAAEHAKALEALRTEHTESQTRLGTEHATKLEQLKEEHAEAIENVKDEHRSALSAMASQMAELKGAHARALAEAQSKAVGDAEAATGGHANALEEVRSGHARAIEETQSSHAKAIEELQGGHARTLEGMRAVHDKAFEEAEDSHAKAIEDVKKQHASELQRLSAEHLNSTAEIKTAFAEELAQVNNTHKERTSALQNDHEQVVSGLRKQVAEVLAKHRAFEQEIRQLKQEHTASVDRMSIDHKVRLDKAHSDLLAARSMVASSSERANQQQLEAIRQELELELENTRSELAETSDALVTLEGALTDTSKERDSLQAQIEALKSGVNPPTPAQVLQADLTQARSDLAKVKQEMHVIIDERSRLDQQLRDSQNRLQTAEAKIRAQQAIGSPTLEQSADFPGRAPGYRRGSDADTLPSEMSHSGRNSRTLGKPPPPTPPPSVPPPPTPTAPSSTSGAVTPRASGPRTSSSSQITRSESPGTLTRSSSQSSLTTVNMSSNHGGAGGVGDSGLRMIAEQGEEIKKLQRQLSHCEADLQANIDLVSTLEAALNDSERNLRKSRVQLGEVTRERDRLQTQIDDLRDQAATAQRNLESVRNSVLLEKQGYESKIQEERAAKEKAREALEARLEEVSRRKNSRLFCM